MTSKASSKAYSVKLYSKKKCEWDFENISKEIFLFKYLNQIKMTSIAKLCNLFETEASIALVLESFNTRIFFSEYWELAHSLPYLKIYLMIMMVEFVKEINLAGIFFKKFGFQDFCFEVGKKSIKLACFNLKEFYKLNQIEKQKSVKINNTNQLIELLSKLLEGLNFFGFEEEEIEENQNLTANSKKFIKS